MLTDLNRYFLLLVFLVVGAVSFLNSQVWAAEKRFVRCASTTSTQNSGLFEYLLPIFEKESGITVQVIAVGTGAALKLGQRGDVDLVMVHARDLELAMVEQGWFVNRYDLMYNDFVVVGPTGDPARVAGSGSVTEAFARVEKNKKIWVSRGDDSGTHKREMKIWQLGGDLPDASADPWYLSVGQGMAKTLRIAGEKQAYTMTDRGTWLAIRDQADLDLEIVFENDPLLNNQYGVMAVNPARHSGLRYGEATAFISWLVSGPGQEAIGSFKDLQGHNLFIPNAR